MSDFINKCYNEWLKDNPNCDEHDFYLLCMKWYNMHKQRDQWEYVGQTKSPQQMWDEGWCKDCLRNYAECVTLKSCPGSKIPVDWDKYRKEFNK